MTLNPKYAAYYMSSLNQKNTEMTLAFLIALTTGARIQTVFTLRLRNFREVVDEDGTTMIMAGSGTGVDTKFQKRIALHVPNWLYNRVIIYVRSHRAERRRNLSKHSFRDCDDQYVFLTDLV